MSDVRFRSFSAPEELAEAAAGRIMAGIVAATKEARPYLLGCPSGRTPKPIYAALGRRCAAEAVDCSRVVLAMMDDYLEADDGGAWQPVDVSAPHSCRRFAEHDVRRAVNAALEPARQVPVESVWFPEPTDPVEFDRRLVQAGGIDMFIVASGASDGHVAFCGPGSSLEHGSSIVELAPTTRSDNTKTFPNLTSIDAVPTHGISVGLGTIRQLARSVLMVLHGVDKRESLRRIRAATGFEPDWPATFIHECANAHVWYDVAAAGTERGTT